jgi:Rps23 Pro-64 3,4-dihydroxylase Tpa1-like proline 4-hydroxylase
MIKVFDDYDLGQKLNFSYTNNKPFPNIVLDNFIDLNVANKCFYELKQFDGWGHDPTDYVKKHQVNKFFTPWDSESLNYLSQSAPTVYNTLQYFNSESFLQFLRNLTGIKNLIADPTFNGGGCHKIHTGGKLSLHIDYNFNSQNHFRVLNFLLYLNPNWKEEWEGALELWDQKEKKCIHKIFPIFNRAAIFTLSDCSIHGHPVPLNCPEDIQRYSLALYYFIEEPNHELYEKRSVVWHEF